MKVLIGPNVMGLEKGIPGLKEKRVHNWSRFLQGSLSRVFLQVEDLNGPQGPIQTVGQ